MAQLALLGMVCHKGGPVPDVNYSEVGHIYFLEIKITLFRLYSTSNGEIFFLFEKNYMLD